MGMTDRDRRDWSLLIFIVPIGILLMMIAGGFAMWATPQWSVQAGMGSSLEIGAGNSQNGPRPLINPQILTPFSWLGTYLTPSGDNPFFVPFVVIEPSATPSASIVPTTTEIPPVSVTVSPPVTVVTTPPANTPTATITSEPPDDEGTPPIPTTCDDSAAMNFGGPLPCTYPPTTCDDTAATNYGDPLPCTYPPTPPTTCDDAAATNYGDPLPCTYPPPGITSTPDPSYTLATPPPEMGVGTLPDNTNPNSDTNIGNIVDGTYIVISLSVVVEPTPDNNYDLTFYEFNNDGTVYLDWIIIGISNNSTGVEYYEVFNWGNGTPDDNSNVGDVAGTEDDNQTTALSEFHDPDGSGPAPQTGILIDVDTATSDPPPNTYNYVVIISPTGGSSEPVEIDAIQATEVPIPALAPPP